MRASSARNGARRFLTGRAARVILLAALGGAAGRGAAAAQREGEAPAELPKAEHGAENPQPKAGAPPVSAGLKMASTTVVSLDGEWLLAVDPKNVGRAEKWFAAPRPEAKKTKVPWIIQDAFPGYHGVAWYWRTLSPPANPHAQGRSLLRFWAVDYTAEVWLNGARVGEHEGGESPFTLDVTDAVRPGERNLLAVRVLNPTHQPIDGIVLNEVPHRNKALPYTAGSAWDQGGIMDSVELLVAPPVRVEDLFVRADWKTGVIRIQANVRNALPKAAQGRLEFTIAPAASGETLAMARIERELPAGDTLVESQLRVVDPHLWELNDPFLYRVTARVCTDGTESQKVDAGASGLASPRRSVGTSGEKVDAGASGASSPRGSVGTRRGFDERSVRCGFRDFRFEKGWFRLNGRRLYLRCSHTGNCCPVGLERPVDPDWLRRDLLNVKAMRFNAIRFIAGVALRSQLDLCDELGLLVYEEAYASWCLADSPKMAERYDESILGMVRRDRNHPSVVIWGLLNETPDGPVFRHALGLLPALRALDDSRMVLLNSGRWDRVSSTQVVGIEAWRNASRADPCVSKNVSDRAVQALGITWQPGQLSFHPGRDGEYSVVRWAAPAPGKIGLAATFSGIAEKATTDVHVLHNGKPLFDAFINVKGGGNEARFASALEVKAGDTLDCAVGYGNGNYGADTTALAVTLKLVRSPAFRRSSEEERTAWDAAADFSLRSNPNGAWSYGQLSPGPAPNAAAFALYREAYPRGAPEPVVGSLSNPGSAVWEDVLSDQHPYQRVPHTADIIRTLRTVGGRGQPLFLSEYGVGSAVDLVRVVRLYEQLGKPDAEDAQFYRVQRDRFLADWARWGLAETFGRPEDYFAACLGKMARARLLGLNAIRSNPAVVGYSLTGTVDQGMTGEGLTTTFRELKPGTFEAVFDGLAPLRWCLFAEPVHVYRRARVRLEAVLANEDALLPGQYPVRLQVFGPDAIRVFERTAMVAIPEPKPGPEPPMVLPVFAEDVAIDGPSGKYRFVAAFERGAAAAGEETEFYVADPAEMPPVEAAVVLWGEDAVLAKWLAEHGIRTRPSTAAGVAPPPSAVGQAAREVILAAGAPPPPGGAAAFRDLAARIARGSTAVFLCPEVFRKGDQPAGWLPLKTRGALANQPSWVYLKDEWATRHPVFEGLPAGLLDHTFYREIIPDLVWAGQEAPAEVVAGAINTSQAYSSGLLVSVHALGAGRFILNTLRIRENLGTHPAAERLLRNLLRYAARDAAQPPAALPPDFDAHLNALGYVE